MEEHRGRKMRDITILDAIRKSDEGKAILIMRKSIVKGQKILLYGEKK